MSCTIISIFSVLTCGQGQIPWRGERWGLPHPSWYRPRGTHRGAHHHRQLQCDTCRRYTWVDYQRLLPCDTCTRYTCEPYMGADHHRPLPCDTWTRYKCGLHRRQYHRPLPCDTSTRYTCSQQDRNLITVISSTTFPEFCVVLPLPYSAGTVHAGPLDVACLANLLLHRFSHK
jgi:hypothetical protein